MSDSTGRRGAPLPHTAAFAAAPPPEGHPAVALALWSAAWLHGAAAPDDVIEVLGRWAPLHLVDAADAGIAGLTGLEWPRDTVGAGPVGLLHALRRAGAGLRLRVLLPAAGDVAGLAYGTAHHSAAMTAGETVMVHRRSPAGAGCAGCLGIVPVRESADVLHWTVYDAGCPGTPPQSPSASEARHALREAVTDATALLAEPTRIGGGSGAHAGVAALLDDDGRGALPAGTPPRAAEAFRSAATVAAIVTLARDRAGDPHSGAGARGQEAALSALHRQVRLARVAAADHTVRALESAAGG